MSNPAPTDCGPSLATLGLTEGTIETLKVRSITPAEVAALADGESIPGYIKEKHGFLVAGDIARRALRKDTTTLRVDFRAETGTTYAATIAVAHADIFEYATESGIFVADPDGEEMPLLPIYGAQATVSFVVKDISPEELERRVREALADEFGPALRRNLKLRTRPVANERVDVYEAGTERLIAHGILNAEVSAIVQEVSPTLVEVRTHIPNSFIIGD